MKNIVFLSYGNQIEYQRATYSILSFLTWKGENSEQTRIICFTDNVTYFEKYLAGFDIHYVILTKERLDSMIAGTGYIHRRKICILQEVAQTYPEDDLLFLDSDTFFTQDPSALLIQIQPEHSLMHISEYRLEQAPAIYRELMSKRLANAEEFPLSFLRMIESNDFDIREEKIRFNKEQYVWNAGTIGINKVHLPLMKDILSVNDQVYAQTKWFISEQLAFCLVLQSFSQMEPCADFISHYYQSKEVVDSFVEKTLSVGFVQATPSEKLAKVKTSTRTINKIVAADVFYSISLGAVKRKKFKKGINFAFKAVKQIPFSFWSLIYIKSRLKVLMLKAKGK
jgi:hypothetical protein